MEVERFVNGCATRFDDHLFVGRPAAVVLEVAHPLEQFVGSGELETDEDLVVQVPADGALYERLDAVGLEQRGRPDA